MITHLSTGPFIFIVCNDIRDIVTLQQPIFLMVAALFVCISSPLRKHRLKSCDLKQRWRNGGTVLHSYRYELAYKEKCNDRYYDILLLELSCKEGDNCVRNRTDTDTIWNWVCEWHHDECKESRNCRTHIIHVYLSEVLRHKNTYIYKSRSCCTARNNACKWA